MSSTFYPRADGTNSAIKGCVEVYLCRNSPDSVGAGLQWFCLDPIFLRLRLAAYMFDPSDLRLSLTTMVAMVRQFYGALVRGLLDCLLQQDLPGSGERGAMTAVRLRLAPVLVVLAMWSMNLIVILLPQEFFVLL